VDLVGAVVGAGEAVADLAGAVVGAGEAVADLAGAVVGAGEAVVDRLGAVADRLGAVVVRIGDDGHVRALPVRHPLSVDFEDIEHPENVLTLTTERGDRVRIISARVATGHERRLYEEDA
jgi:hypothetical protein